MKTGRKAGPWKDPSGSWEGMALWGRGEVGGSPVWPLEPGGQEGQAQVQEQDQGAHTWSVPTWGTPDRGQPHTPRRSPMTAT